MQNRKLVFEPSSNAASASVFFISTFFITVKHGALVAERMMTHVITILSNLGGYWLGLTNWEETCEKDRLPQKTLSFK